MISGAHVIVCTKDPEADRAFFRDVLGFHSVDAGHGWLRKMGFDYKAAAGRRRRSRPLSTKASERPRPGQEIKAPHDEAPHKIAHHEGSKAHV
jgi:catechol 2,3-dioxygenase-like lactoylglutathione lyase family enzyme